MRRYLRRITRPEVTSRQDLFRYVATTTIAAIIIALVVDVANQLVFFTNWSAAVRSWIITIIAATTIAVPILYLVGKAHLELWKAKRRVEELSRLDPLTGLLNRRTLFDETESGSTTLMALAIIDIDHFKRVNDTYGHRTGDIALRMVAQVMASELESCGRLCRLGGEEFALLTTDQSPEALVRQLQQLCHRLSATPFVCDGAALKLTASIGVAVRMHRSMDELYSEADRALYRAKAGGRNQISVSAELRDLLPPVLLESIDAAAPRVSEMRRG